MSHPVPLSRSYIINQDLSFSSQFYTSFDMCSAQLIFSVLRHILAFKVFQSCDVLLSQSPRFCTVQGRTSNQCFHHSFLEASSYFSILPLVIHSSWKRLLSHCYPGASILTPIFWAGCRVGSQGGRREGGSLGSWTGREILLGPISYHVQEV